MFTEQPPTCKGCGQAILMDPVQAVSCDWHPKCFRCSSCGRRLNNWYIQINGNLYCKRDYSSKFGDRCNGCSHVITGPFMVAGEHRYHPECFQCKLCQTLIGEGDSYALVERSFLYCDHCYRIGPAKPYSLQTQVAAPQTSPETQTPRRKRKPHSIQMVEIPPTPEYHSQSSNQQHNHHHDNNVQDKQNLGHKQGLPTRKLQLSLQVASPDTHSTGTKGSASYRYSLTQEGGRLTPCVQISELDSCPELHGLAVGDRILEVNGTAVRDKTLDEIQTLLTNYKNPVHVVLERDLSPLRLPPEDDFLSSSSPVRNVLPRNTSSDDITSTSASEGETVVVLDQPVKLRPKGSLRARGHSPSRRRSKSPSPCPSAKQKSIDLSRSHSFSTRQQDHRAFRATDLILGEVLGQGFFGQAIKATHRVTGEQMVLKELHNFDEDAQKSFLREVSMLRSLSHPCVLKFLGVLYRDKKLNLVTEFIDGGTLSDLLLDHSVELSWKQRIAFAKDIAAGMSYLHSMNIIHRDLNSQNCLVRKDQSVVVADFGLAKIFPRREVPSLSEKEKEGGSGGGSSSAGGRKKKRFSRRKRGTVVGNPYWMAPEMMTKGVYDEKVDVFSYGIIVCETIARVTADPDYLPRSFDFGLNVEAFYQRFCKEVPEPYFMLGVLCAQLEPDQRPSFEKILVLCEALLLHVEHGMTVPTDLQGSTVEFYRSSKEKMYGQNYKDVDSCMQVNTSMNQEVVADTSMDGKSQNETNKCTDSSQNGDYDHYPSVTSAGDGGGSLSCSSSDGAVSGTEITEAQPFKVLIHTDLCAPHSKEGDKAELSSGMSALNIHPLSTASRIVTDENRLQDLKLNVDDVVWESSVATTNEDYAYFSCSSDSPSISMSSPCLSVEDFASCRSSPNILEKNIQNPLSGLEPSAAADISNKIGHHETNASIFNDTTIEQAAQCFLASDERFPTKILAQAGTNSANNIASSSVINPIVDSLQHSNVNGPKPCQSPPKDYQATLQLEYGTVVSPPPSSALPPPTKNLNEFDV